LLKAFETTSMQNTHLTLEEIAQHCGGQMPLPWQAHEFAMTLQLHEKGLFTWPEWAAALTQEIRNAQVAGDADTGSTYYTHWLNALESMVLAKELGTAEQIHDLEHAWEDAAARTPHGQPIVLDVQGSGVSVSN